MAVITKRIKGHLYRYEETWDLKTKKPAWKYLGPVEAKKARKPVRLRPLKSRLLQAIKVAEELTGRKYEGPEPFILIRALSHRGGVAVGGQATTKGLLRGQVEVHPFMLSKLMVEPKETRDMVIAHEALHLVCPDWDEDRVQRLTDKAQATLAKVRE